MDCKLPHIDILPILDTLPNANISKSKPSICSGCTFELGYDNGKNNNSVSVQTALTALNHDNNTINTITPRDTTAYLKGFELGKKVSTLLDLYKYFNDSTFVFKRGKQIENLIAYLPIDSTFVIGVFRGKLSQYDLLIRYSKYDNSTKKWSRLRKPKHIHWVVDVMIKNEFSPSTIAKFIKTLKYEWDNQIIIPLTSEQEQNAFLNPERIYRHAFIETYKYANTFSVRGEYPLLFLVILAELLMTQERTNYSRAFMFRNLLDKLSQHDFFGTISTATHNGR